MNLTMPVREYVVSQRFGENANGYAGYGLQGHNGIDLAVVERTPVMACDDGVIEASYSDGSGYGELVKVRHGWGVSYYGHLSYRMEQAGAPVRRGQVIGLSGNTGNSTGPHLHFEIRPDGESKRNGYNGAIDPWPLLTNEAPFDTELAVAIGDEVEVVAQPWLNVRVDAGINKAIIGKLMPGKRVKVTRVEKTGGNIWFEVLIPAMICGETAGNELVKKIE